MNLIDSDEEEDYDDEDEEEATGQDATTGDDDADLIGRVAINQLKAPKHQRNALKRFRQRLRDGKAWLFTAI